MNPNSALKGIVFQSHTKGNITEVTFVSLAWQRTIWSWPSYEFRAFPSKPSGKREEVMNRHRQSATWLGAVLGTVCALLVLALGAHASDHRGALTEEFHQTYALTADGRVELDNINGDVHISSWDQNQVKVDAIKYADSKERL
ncbi:MAG: hypothetical protein ACXV3T_02535, partial [Halobacteriota archaeon]